jgi:hypothetical protein
MAKTFFKSQVANSQEMAQQMGKQFIQIFYEYY